MASLTEVTKAALEPWVGTIVADACLRGAASSLGLTVADLGPEHLSAMETHIKLLLSPVAPPAAIDQVIDRVRLEMGE